MSKHLRIAKPCEVPWQSMSGDERVRHCGLCDLDVHDFASMTREEVAELLRTTEGRVCGRLSQRADGTVVTRDSPTSLLRTAAVAAVIGLSALVPACTTVHQSSIKLDVERAETAQAASLMGIVRDESGSPLPGVAVIIRDEQTQLERSAVTDVAGNFALPSLSDGVYRLEVTLPGLESLVREHLALKQNEITRAQIRLRYDDSLTMTLGIIAVDPEPEPPGTTTFSEEFLRNLPIRNGSR